MANRALIAFALWFASLPAFAVYYQMTPPTGWALPNSKSGGYATFTWPKAKVAGPIASETLGDGISLYRPNEYEEGLAPQGQTPVLQWYTRLTDIFPPAYAQALPKMPVVVAPTIINVGGNMVRMPSSMRFASNAARYAAQQGFRPPNTLIPLVAMWITAVGLEWMWDEVTKRWVKADSNAIQSDGYKYTHSFNNELFNSAESACRGFFAIANQNYDYMFVRVVTGGCYYRTKLKTESTYPAKEYWLPLSRVTSTCPAGWYMTPAGCLQNPQTVPITQPEFESGLAPHPLPIEVVPYLPDGVPVEDPVINPQPVPVGPPTPRIVPTGDPVPNPKYDPSSPPSPGNQPFTQPGIRINPSPVPKTDPWRVDVNPVDIPVPTGDPETNPSLNPTNPASAPQANPKPAEQTPLCKEFPNISACAPLGNAPDKEAVQNREINVQVNPEGGFGPDMGSCPAPRTLNLAAGPISMPYGLICDLATGVRPLVLTGAFLAAALMVVGVGRKQ